MTRVYFIKPIGEQGPIKIGCSCSPMKRLSSLRLWSPYPLEIIAEIAGDQNLEKRFHATFLNWHVSHEWFDWSPRLQAAIDSINAGTFDLNTLLEPFHMGRGNARREVFERRWSVALKKARQLERAAA